MSRPIIEVQKLSKKYSLGVVGITTIKEEFAWLKSRWRGAAPDIEAGEFWALRDVSFSVAPGEIIGVVGRNGAGKSTLLKILSRITEPTSGRAVMRGRVASLLEVGTGFHQDLTGRENVFLNGTILGMKRAEIASRLDEIVAFAEVDRFIDTPVKHYSSGMRVRLAFAIAAHLHPEILIVDEVLAVGDAAFQQKCMGKMQEIAGAEGRTILFVSHNTGALLTLCDRAILLRKATVDRIGDTTSVIQHYLNDASTASGGEYDVSEHTVRSPNAKKIIRKISLAGADGKPTSVLTPDEPFTITLDCASAKTLSEPRVAVAIEDEVGRRLLTMASYFSQSGLPALDGAAVVRCACEGLQLGPGRYLLSASIGTRADGLLDSLNGVAWFEIRWSNNYPSGEAYLPVYGPVLKTSRWTIESSTSV